MSGAVAYRYRMEDGSEGRGTFTLLDDGTFVDESGGAGTWQSRATPPGLQLRYRAGVQCGALSIGRFTTPTQLRGPRLCQDGSGTRGAWVGTLSAP